ncbi:VCBS domain-containing protein [Yoonia sp.]|uniref:VCBS domain-containing protein n=1 Tax=Yoonia sp. TaxID=2212373 RepID=UPI0023B6024F
MAPKSTKKPGGGGNDDGTPDPGLVLIGTDDDDRLTGGSGDDFIRGGFGNDKINGRDGYDTAVYDGSFDDFALRLGSRGIWTVTDLNTSDGDEGVDSLSNIERLQFNDYSYNLSGDNPAVFTTTDTTIYATAGEEFSFNLNFYDVDDSAYLEIYDRGGNGDKIQFATTSETIGTSGTVSETTVSFSQNGSADALGVADFSRGYLAQGETETLTLTFRAGNSTDGWTYQDIDVVFEGVNDAPTLAAISDVTVIEDAGPVTLDLAQFADDIDSDDTGASLTYEIISGPSTVGLSFDGSVLTVDPASGFQLLSADEFIDYTIEVQATDAHGATTQVQEISLRVQGANDPITFYGLPDGKPDYALLGDNPFNGPSSGVMNALFDDPSYLTLLGFDDGNDTFVLQADDLLNFTADTFPFSVRGTTNYDALPIDTQAGDDKVLIALTGDAVEFQFNDIITGDGRDVVVIDVQTPFGIESFGNSISTGANDDQIFLNIDTAGVIQFALNDFSTGSGNDTVNIEIKTTRSDGPSALGAFKGNDINLGSGDDRLTIDMEVPNGIDVGIDGNIDAGRGDDIVEISNAGSSLSDDAFASFRTLGLYSDIFLGDGDDVFIFDVTAFDGEGAEANIYGGSTFGVLDTGFDTVMLQTGNIADFDVTMTDVGDWTIVQGGQTLYLTDIESVMALDGSISDMFIT